MSNACSFNLIKYAYLVAYLIKLLFAYGKPFACNGFPYANSLWLQEWKAWRSDADRIGFDGTFCVGRVPGDVGWNRA